MYVHREIFTGREIRITADDKSLSNSYAMDKYEYVLKEPLRAAF